MPSKPLQPMLPSISVSGEEPGHSRPLLAGEGERFARMGLGKGLDCTLVHPWTSKTSYQAQDVREAELEVITEGQHLKHFLELAEDYVNIHAGLENTLESPSYRCDGGVAADAHRTHGETHVLRGRMVLTRKVGFRVASPGEGDSRKSRFEQQLERFIQRERSSPMEPGVSKSEPELCYDFIHLVGGMTHFVSSISLGAMEYCVTRMPGRVEAGAGQGSSMASVRRRINSIRGTRRATATVSEKIGRIREDGVKAGSADEGVLRYSYMPLTSLVRQPQLASHLKHALKLYVRKRLRRKSETVGISDIMTTPPSLLPQMGHTTSWYQKPQRKAATSTGS